MAPVRNNRRRKSTGQDDSIAIRQDFRIWCQINSTGLWKDGCRWRKRVVVAIGPGENDNSKFQWCQPPVRFAGASILAHARSANAWRPFGIGAVQKQHAIYQDPGEGKMRTKIPRIAQVFSTAETPENLSQQELLKRALVILTQFSESLFSFCLAWIFVDSMLFCTGSNSKKVSMHWRTRVC